jgi:hypothetical protein
VAIANNPPAPAFAGQTDEFGGLESPAVRNDLNDFYG